MHSFNFMDAQKPPRLFSFWFYTITNLIIALTYYGLAELSRHIASTPNSVTPVWPPDGLAVGVTLIYGSWVLPGIFLGSFLANIQAFWNLQDWTTFSVSVLGVLGIAAGTTIGTWLGTYLLHQATRKRYPFSQVTDTIKFLVYAGLMGPMVNATVGVAMLVFSAKAPLSAYSSIWPVWWISNVAGIFILTPVLLSLSNWLESHNPSLIPKRLLRPSTLQNNVIIFPRKGAEIFILTGLIASIGQITFWNTYPLAYMLIPLLIWAAFRFGEVGATLATFIISVIAILGTVRGLGTFANENLNQSLMGLQSFITVIVFTSLVLTAVLSERMQAELRLRSAFSELQISNAALETYAQELAENNHLLENTLQELRSTQAQMIQSEKMSALGNLVAGVAHEINNPVGFLKGNIQPALDYVADLLSLVKLYQQEYPQENPVIQAAINEIDLEFLSTDLPKLIRSMNEGVNRVQSISTSLRTFSRADSDYPVAFNLQDGLESTLLILKHRLKAHEQRPEIHVIKHYDDIPLVDCYAGQINQVFMNILANAIDVFDEMAQVQSVTQLQTTPPTITIRTVADANQVQISIRDNGKGMDDDVQSKVFDHLFTTKSVGKGTGLGLAIARQIVTEKHAGSLDVRSELGRGTEFCICLPVQLG